jgi:PAS domain S-box-containing protein
MPVSGRAIPTRRASSKAEKLLNAIVDSLDVNLAMIDEKGIILEVNDAWRRFARENGGNARPTGVGANYVDLCRRLISTCSDAQNVLDGLVSVMTGRAMRFRYPYRCDSPCRQRWFVMTVVPHPAIRGGAIICHQDDSEARRIEVRYGELLDSVRAIVWRAEAPSFHTTFASKQAEDILGFPAESWTRDQEFWQKQVHPEDRDWVLQYTSQETAARRKHSFEYRIFDARGRIVWLRNIVNVIVVGEVIELVGISIDVSERKRAEEERDLLQTRLFRSLEEERSLIARELHDDIGQSLALLNYKLQLLKQEGTADSVKAVRVRELQALTTRIANDVQRVSHGLHSVSLDLLGLAAAAEQHCREWALHSRAEVQLDIKEIPRKLDRDIALCIFRVLQECMRNASKHSHASRVMISLSMQSNQIELQISDNGVGFDPGRETARHGLGLASIRERIRLVHGRFLISSSPGKGTQVTATAPFREAELAGGHNSIC